MPAYFYRNHSQFLFSVFICRGSIEETEEPYINDPQRERKKKEWYKD